MKLTVNLPSMLAEFESMRRVHVAGLDTAMEGVKRVRLMDQMLLDLGIQAELQLPPVAVEPEREEPTVVVERPGEPDLQVPIADVLANEGLDASTPPPGPIAVDLRPDVPTTGNHPSEPAPSRKSLLGTHGKYTDEQKHATVTLAKEVGDAKAAKSIGCHSMSVLNWRKQGFGGGPTRDPKTARNAKQGDVSDTPSLRCPTCHAHLPILGDGGADDRQKAWDLHYEDSSVCYSANRRRSR